MKHEGFRGVEYPSKKKIEACEGKEQKSEHIKATYRAVLKWIEALSEKLPQRHKALSPSFTKGAEFVPTILLTLMTGCNPHSIVECTESEQDLLTSMVDWLEQHPKELETEMDTIWPNHEISASQLIETLSGATLECGLEGSKQEELGLALLHKNTIVIAVDTDRFDLALERYEKGKWTEEYTFSELLKRYDETHDDSIIIDRSAYNYAVMSYAQVLAHEAAHLALQSGHTNETENALQEATIDGVVQSGENSFDEIYAWGDATNQASLNWYENEQDQLNDVN